MAQITTYKCDRCGVMKFETTHWFAVQATPEMVHVKRFENALDGDRHACGEKCVLGEVADFMAKAKRIPVIEVAA